MPAAKAKLTAAEIGVLWATYMYASVNQCMMKHLHAKADDDDCRQAMGQSLEALPGRMQGIADFFQAEGIPVPVAFGDADVDPAAPRLFSDNFALDYMRTRSAVSVGSLAYALQVAGRPDVTDFIRREMIKSMEINKLTTNMMVAKGIFVKGPIIAVSHEISYARKPAFLGSLLGPERPLTAPEITQLFLNIETNRLGKDLVIGFSQVARSMELREYCRRGADIAGKHNEIFAHTLHREDIPVSTTWDSRVTASTAPPYSDNFMLLHITMLNSLGLANYGLALGTSVRADLQADYIRLTAEIMEYAKDGMDIALKNAWLEEPPQMVDRRELALMR